jgi:hypothetical protein
MILARCRSPGHRDLSFNTSHIEHQVLPLGIQDDLGVAGGGTFSSFLCADCCPANVWTRPPADHGEFLFRQTARTVEVP